MKTNKRETSKDEVDVKNKISRKKAFSKMGYIAISAATTMMLLSVPKAAHASPLAPPAPDSSGGTWTKRTP